VREPELIGRRRTYARLALILLAAGVALATQAPLAAAKVPRLVFPVVANVQYEDDFGDPRPQGSHEGNDIMAPWRAPVVAVEPGKVRIYTRSASAGCMLYLYGKSGTTYLFIHLNNDLTKNNDNDGGCKRGVAYAPGLRDGQQVRAGQLVGYVGDSGDAAGLHHHLHFELHPGDGNAVSPYSYLRKAERLLFVTPSSDGSRDPAASVTLTLVGAVVAFAGEVPAAAEPGSAGGGAETSGNGGPGSGGGTTAPPPPPPSAAGWRIRSLDDAAANGTAAQLTVRVTRVRLSTGGSWLITRRVVLTVPAGAVLERGSGAKARWTDLSPGTRVTVTTAAVAPTLDAQRARTGFLRAARVLVRG
jgi:hypothetical protein